MGIASVWLAWQAPILAAVAALACLLGGRALGQPWLARAAGGAALLAGWAALAWRPVPLQLLLGPRGWVERLVAVGLAALLAGLARPVLPPRLGRWVPMALFVFAGAWLAVPLGHGGYWRVLIGTAFGAWLLARLVADDPLQAFAAALAGWGALAVLQSPWSLAALVPTAAAAVWVVGASMGAAGRRPGGAAGGKGGSGKGAKAGKGAGKGSTATAGRTDVPGFTVAAGIASATAAAVLGAGRLPRGGFGAADAAALAPVGAVLLLRVLGGRMGRLGRFGMPVAAAAAAGIAVAGAWLAGRLLRLG